jgi:N-acyl-D-aspartate/D-glutamate deacylase
MKVIFTLLIPLLILGCAHQSPRIDLLITSGQVFDGTDRSARLLDIGICGDTICYLEEMGKKTISANRTIDAKGLIVSPGFIDPHTHSLEELTSQNKHANLNYLFQGVTTVINGNDGDGPTNIQQTISSLNNAGIGTNTSFLVGHGSLRRQVMGTAGRHATDAELTEMKVLLRTAMQQGALGLSSGLYYVPGSFASKQEVVELAKVAAQYNGIYDTHLRDESTFNIGFLAALQEAIDIAREAKIHLHVAHIKALGVDVWGQSQQAIDKINLARSEGVSISADQYPWRASGTFLRSAVVPKWAMADSEAAFMQRLANPDFADRIKLEITENIRRRGGAEALLVTASEDTQLVGKTLAQLAIIANQSETNTVVDMVSKGRTRVASFNMNQEDINNFMLQSWVVTSSDGTNGHPRKFASFPQKFQEYVEQKKLISLQGFIHSSTGQTATILGLSDRGFIRVGAKADIAVIRLSEYKANANFKLWNQLSEGIVHLLVNGQLVIEKGQYNGILAGRFIAKKN